MSLLASSCRKVFRFLAKILPQRLCMELPRYGYIDQFVRAYCLTLPEHRIDYLRHIFASDPYEVAIRRYGGVTRVFCLILGDSFLPGYMADNFVSDLCPRPKVRDAANSVIQIGQFVGLPKELQ